MAKLRELLIDVRTNTAKFEQGIDRVEGRLKSITSAAKSSAAALVGAFAVGGIASSVKQAIDHADAIAKDARNVGLLSDEFQKLSFAASRSGVQQSIFNSSMTAFVKRVGEAKQGLGPLAGFLKKYDDQLLKNIQASNSQTEALDLVFAAINKAKSETEKAAIANAAFSRSGLRMKLMAADYKALTKQAEELGLVLSNDLTASAEAASDELENLSTKTKKEFTETALALAPLTSKINTMIAGIGKSVGNLYNSVSAGDEFSQIEVLQQKIGELHTEVISKSEKLKTITDESVAGVIGAEVDRAKAEIGRLQEIIAKKQGKDNGSVLGLDGADQSVNAVSASVEKLNSLVGGKSVDEWKKLKNAVEDVRKEFEGLTEVDAGPLNKYQQTSSEVSAFNKFGSANQAFRSGRFEDALKAAREAKDLLEQIQRSGGEYSSDLAQNVANIAIKAAEKQQSLADAAISFDEKATVENADELLKKISEQVSSTPVPVNWNMELIDGIPTFTEASASAEELSSKLGQIGSSLEQVNGTTIDIKFSDPKLQAEKFRETAKKAADGLEVVAKGKIGFDSEQAKNDAKKVIDEITAQAQNNPVTIPVKLAQQGVDAGIGGESLEDHVLKAGGL